MSVCMFLDCYKTTIAFWHRDRVFNLTESRCTEIVSSNCKQICMDTLICITKEVIKILPGKKCMCKTLCSEESENLMKFL